LVVYEGPARAGRLPRRTEREGRAREGGRGFLWFIDKDISRKNILTGKAKIILVKSKKREYKRTKGECMKLLTGEEKKRLQVWVPQELYDSFKEAVKPLKMGDCVLSYMRIVVNSKNKSLVDVVDEGLKQFMKK